MAAAPAVILEPAAPVAELALVPAPPPRLTLYALEEQLLALADTAEMVEPEQEQEFLAQFQRALISEKQKVDATAHFIAELESRVELADAEIKRLGERKAAFLTILNRVNKYVTFVLDFLGKDAKGKCKRLEGAVSSFQLKKCPPSVEITDEVAVPAEYKAATVTIPLPLWEELLDSLDLDFAGKVADAVRKAKIDISKTAVKEALQAKAEVPGARLVDDKMRLERK